MKLWHFVVIGGVLVAVFWKKIHHMLFKTEVKAEHLLQKDIAHQQGAK